MEKVFEKTVKFNNLFNILLRLAIGFPVLIWTMSLYLLENNDVVLILTPLLLLFSVVALFIFKKKFTGEYKFLITNTKVKSNYKSETESTLTYQFLIKDIKSLIKKPNKLNALNSNVHYSIQLIDGTTYDVPPNFLSPDKVFKVITDLRPELTISIPKRNLNKLFF